MKKIIIIISVLSIMMIGCEKNNNNVVAIPENDPVINAVVDTDPVDVVVDVPVDDQPDTPADVMASWESYFEDETFAKAIRNGIERELGMSLEEHGFEKVFQDTSLIGVHIENEITGERLEDGFREKITSLKGLENFTGVGGVDFMGLINVPRDDFHEALYAMNSRSRRKELKIVRLSDTQVTDLGFFNPGSLSDLRISNCDITDATFAAVMAGNRVQFLYIDGTNITRFPEMDSSRLNTLELSNLNDFDASSMENLKFEQGEKSVTNFRAWDTYLDLRYINHFTSIINFSIGSDLYTVEDLKQIEKLSNPNITKIVLKMGDYSGFGAYLQSGDTIGRLNQLTLVDTFIDEAFLDDLKGRDGGQTSGYYVQFYRPVFKEGLEANDENREIIIMSHAHVIGTGVDPFVPDTFWTYFYNTSTGVGNVPNERHMIGGKVYDSQ